MDSKKNRSVTKGKYYKIPLLLKVKLISQVVKEKKTIREASFMLGVNYSSAKTLIRQYRTNQLNISLDILPQNHQTEPVSQVRCGFRMIDEPVKMEVSETELYQNNEYEIESSLRPLSPSFSPIHQKFEIISSVLFD